MARDFQKVSLVVLACLLLLSFAGIASAGTVIVSRPGDPEGSPTTISPTQQLAVSWTQAFDSTNTAIEAYNIQNNNIVDEVPAGNTITFKVLLGSPVGSEFASQDFVFDPLQSFATLLLFSNLNLDAGTYFLVAFAQGTGSWLTGDFGNEYADPNAGFGVEMIGTGAPVVWDNSFVGTGFKVEGDFAGSPIPEPATVGLIGAGLLLVAGIVRRRRS